MCDATASPAPLLGHNFPEAAMHIPACRSEMAWSLLALILCGSGLGILIELMREG